jgi:hypothetical protein
MRGSRAREVDLIGEIQTETSMPRFKNRRRERFAWMIAKGMYAGPLLTAGLLRHLSCAGSASKRSWSCAAPGGRQRRRDGAAPESLQRRVAVSAFADSPWCHGEGPREALYLEPATGEVLRFKRNRIWIRVRVACDLT